MRVNLGYETSLLIHSYLMFIENNVYSRGSAWYFSSMILGSILSNPNICFVIAVLLIEKVSLSDFKLLVRQLEIEPDL